MDSQLKIAGKDDLIMPNLIKFFNKKEHLNIILPIIEGKSTISLRLIDWFVTNYIKDKIIIHSPTKDQQNLIMHHDYKAQLNAFSKKKFDPFCRRKRINFYYNEDDYVETTIGQLNFFRWFIENKYIDYMIDHLSNIENAMRDSEKSGTKKKRRKKTCHNIKLSKVPTKKDDEHIKFIISFD